MALATGVQLPRVQGGNATNPSWGKKRGHANYSPKVGTPTAAPQLSKSVVAYVFPNAVDVLNCSEEEFLGLLTTLKEATEHTREPIMKEKKRTKGYTKRQMAVMQEELISYQSTLLKACTMLRESAEAVNTRLSKLNVEESLLNEYYQTLDSEIELGEKYGLPKDGRYHLQQRELRRIVPRQRYGEERVFLEGRYAKLTALLHELEEEEHAIFPGSAGKDAAVAEAAVLGREHGMGNSTGEKLEDAYGGSASAAGGGNNLELRLRMRPLLQKLQELCIVPALSPSSVKSRLRKELLLPFSARVLALKIDEGNNAGERFVEWYVNTVIDPLAMAQLVELVPREYLVTTTVRFVNACDTYLSLRQAQALPDVLHVLLQAIAEGRPDALATLVLSPSDSYLHALENKEHVAIVFYAALVAGQMEVLRHLMSVGFYNVNALIAWLFLNPNTEAPAYTAYMTEVRSSVKEYMQKEVSQQQDVINAETLRSELDGEITASALVLSTVQSSSRIPSVTRGLCETLRRFLQERRKWKSHVASLANKTTNDTHTKETRGASSESASMLVPQLQSVGVMQTTTQTSFASEVSFSHVLEKRRLDRIPLSSVKCAVLPAVTTSFMRRVDLWGYTPLKATTSHFLLVGDTSTANAHVVHLPPQHAELWPDDFTETSHAKWKREEEKASAKMKGPCFYYEVHISLKFLLSGIPVSTTVFSSLPPSEDRSGLQTSTVFVGWCSEECVAAADGRSTHPALGSDHNSIGISFDILHRAAVSECVEEIILRPMKHERGRTSVYPVRNEVVLQDKAMEDLESNLNNSCFPLLRILLEKNDEKGNNMEFGCHFNGPFSSPIYGSLNFMDSSSASEDYSLSVGAYASTRTVVPNIEFVSQEGNGSMADEGGKSRWASVFACNSIVLRGVSVYNSQSLVVGCSVNFGNRSASFTVNGESLGTAFTRLPSQAALRPAVSLQASKQISEMLQRVTPSDAAIVRFVFEEAHLLVTQKVVPAQSSFPAAWPFAETRKETPERNAENQQNRRLIPGVLASSCPLLFDERMMQCALLRLITCGESTLLTGDDVNELMQAEGKTLSLGSTVRVTASSVRQLLNAQSNADDLLFFPPVLVKRRSDDTQGENGVAIIPEEVPLVPLCVALAQRQRVPAYCIAMNPLTDYLAQDDVSRRQRRMALLASATLGYMEVLYVLLERMSIAETLSLFTLNLSRNDPDYELTGKQMRIFSLGSSRKCTSATMLHRVEYTPLHCALLEEHYECVHLLLYYLNRLLPEEYRRHAVNVLTRSGETALLMACRLGYTKIAERLLAMGAAPSSFDRVTRTNCLELACASRSEEIAVALLQTPHYCSQVAVNLFGVATPICWCALNNLGSLIPLLLKNGANLNVTLDGLTPLLLAVTFGSEEAALQLLNCCEGVSSVSSHLTQAGHPPQSHSSHGETNEEDSVNVSEVRRTAVVDVNALDPLTQSSALHLACELGQLKVARGLIAKGALLSLHNKAKFANALHLAIINGHEELALEILEYAKDKLRRGHNVLNITAPEKNADTALHLAARQGMLQVIEYVMLQFSEDEVARLSGIRVFAKRPTPVNVVATNRQGMTPLLVAIHAHQEAAAQLIASLMPETLPNPGGPVIDGTCTAVLASDAEGLDNVTLYFLSQPRYAAKESFREGFFARYNAKRRQIDLREDGVPLGVDEKVVVGFTEPEKKRKRDRTRKTNHNFHSRRGLALQRTNVSAALLSRTSLSQSTYAEKLGERTGVQGTMLSRRHTSGGSQASRAGKPRRRSTFVRMLLAKGGIGLTTRMFIQILEQGFPLEELYVMVDTISTETTRSTQTVAAMQHVETLILFFREYGGVRIATRDAVVFARQLLASSALAGIMESDQLENAKKRMMEMRPLCRELVSVIRSRGQRPECVEDMRQIIEQRGVVGPSLEEEVTTPFGFTVLQLAATLGLPHVCEFLLNECELHPLYVPPTSSIPCSDSKWLLSPFRLALRSLNVKTISIFLLLELQSGDVHELLEHKELPRADKLQQTALQEIIRKPLDTLSAATATDTLYVMRLLLHNGAVVQGNFDNEGDDAWMLAVRAAPGKGTKLEVFFEEDVKLGMDAEEEGSEEDNMREFTGKSARLRVDSHTWELEPMRRRESCKNGWTTMSFEANEEPKVPLRMPFMSSMTAPQWVNSPTVMQTSSDGTYVDLNKERYYAQLIYLCAEYNPQCLSTLLERYPHVLSPSIVNPVTGDTLLLFLLRLAANIYLAECGVDVLSQNNTGNEEVALTPRCMTLEAKTISTSDDDSVPYRDPITIPTVRSLLLVVEQLLRKFFFGNVYYEHSDGQTALALAARLSSTPIVSLIVQQRNVSKVSALSRKNTEESEAILTAPSDFSEVASEKAVINDDLARNLESSSCWVLLATRLYYAEEEMEMLLTILRHLRTASTRFSFLSMVYSNLHPIVALRIVEQYANDVKKIFTHPEAINAFWSNVLYAQFVGRLEEVPVTSAEWSSILSVLLPAASAIPIYLIKTTPTLPSTPRPDSPLSTLPSPDEPASPTKKERTRNRAAPNWTSIVTKTRRYVRQLAAAAVCVASPPSAIASLHGGGVIPSSQRQVLTVMSNHFHELIELSVRYDNSTMLLNLMNSAPAELQACVKNVWRELMMKYHIDVVAIAAGSMNIIRTLASVPETAPLLSSERYERIDLATGLSEEVVMARDAVSETSSAATKLTHSPGNTMLVRGEHTGSFSAVISSRRSFIRATVAANENKWNHKKTRDSKQTVVNILALDVSRVGMSPDDGVGDAEKYETSLQYMDVMTAARERTTASAVTWGIGAAARPIALQEKGRANSHVTTQLQPNSFSSVQRKVSAMAISDDFPERMGQPQGTDGGGLSMSSVRRKSRKRSATLEVTRASNALRQASPPLEQLDPLPPPQYFPYYLCDWALHATLVLHAPRPSCRTIDTLLYLMDQRAPLTASAVQLFLVASRPLNYWESSDGQPITLNYATRTNKDTLLHILVQNNQLQLAHYFLAAALCYFTYYQYDPPSTMPPHFALMDMPKPQKPFQSSDLPGTNETEELETLEEESVYPAVFLRSMLQINKRGLTPFDYARGPMVSLLMEYGCVPPTYRPNPRGFCRAIRLSFAPSAFYRVPRLLLVSANFIELHDEGKPKPRNHTAELLARDAADAMLIRNQKASQHTTKVNFLPSVLAGNVSLLHLGLCSADDELVLQYIKEKRERQLLSFALSQVPQNAPTPYSMPQFLGTAVGTRPRGKMAHPTVPRTNRLSRNESPVQRGAAEKELPSALKLMNILRERGFVLFPLILPLDLETSQPPREGHCNDSTAILISLTPMALATCAGVVRRDENPQANKWPSKPKDAIRSTSNTKTSFIPPRFTPTVGKSYHPAEALDAWVASRRSAKTATPGKDPHMNLLVRSIENGLAGRTIQFLGLYPAPSYESQK
ncbi:hypothetical protein TraAM80_07109 [Trypanosoma rangeli]|uniref:SPRY domain-containing protein n=1 Tax=Trypanosoma rangeli TaxID=5698 RepID=A0A422N6Z5_TRYRA|nr:uncharacterized protein TraAM80_07109 [Trypanosoma rangeli]RNF01248.1 hypothetical protein TraAM80_07109 [Trypanosoma rangeli]|eukprot:RNF01248.1 hypothetical protein TraAM80_07109 [Trypanosoma rangeli]